MIECPYCGRKFQTVLSRTHLKMHGKTAMDLAIDFPDMEFKCTSFPPIVPTNKKDLMLLNYRDDKFRRI